MASCPNVVRLVDWFEFRFNQNAIHMDLIFEYCTFDLRKVISNSKVRFQIDEVKCFLRQILNGLLFMHGKKVPLFIIKVVDCLKCADLHAHGHILSSCMHDIAILVILPCIPIIKSVPSRRIFAQTHSKSLYLWLLPILI